MASSIGGGLFFRLRRADSKASNSQLSDEALWHELIKRKLLQARYRIETPDVEALRPSRHEQVPPTAFRPNPSRSTID